MLPYITLCILPPSPADAQSPVSNKNKSGAADLKTIQKLTIIPAELLSKEALMNLTGIGPGDKLNYFKIDAGIREILKTHKDFYNVTVEFKNGTLEFRLIKKTYLKTVRLRGNRRFSNSDLKKITTDKTVEFSTQLVETWVEKIRARYRKAGFLNVIVKTSLSGSAVTGGFDLMVDIAEGKRATIRSISFTGDKVLSDFGAGFLIGSFKGGPYDGEQVEKDIGLVEDYLRSKGYVKLFLSEPDVRFSPEFNTVDIKVRINAGAKLSLKFIGNRSFSRLRLAKETLFEQKGGFDDAIIARSKQKLEEFYHSRGFSFASVLISQKYQSKTKLKLVVKIKEGKRFFIKGVSFDGNLFVKTKELKKVITQKKGFPFKPVLFNRSVMDKEVESIQGLYKSKGFQDATVTYGFEFGKHNVKIKYLINEGLQTRVGSVTFEGNVLIKSAALVGAAAASAGVKPEQMQDGAVYIDKIFSQTIPDTIKYLYSRKGYIYTSVNTTVTYAEESKHNVVNAKAVYIRYVINEDRRAVIGGVRLRPSLKIKNHVIKRELLFKAGEYYNYEKILRTRQQLYQLGLFSRVNILTIDADNRYVKNIEVSVQDKDAGFGAVGAGYANRERFKGFVELGYNNLSGIGRKIKARGEWSKIDSKESLEFREPWFMGKKIDANISLTRLVRDNLTYRIRQTALNLGLEKSFSRTVSASLFYVFELNKLLDVNQETVLSRSDRGRVNIASINYSIVRDSRNDPFNPSSGSLSSLSLMDAAHILASDVQLVKLSGQAYRYYAPLKWMVLAFGGTVGMAKNFGETIEVPLSERFFLGGRSRVRGYEQDMLGRPGITIINGVPVGGNAMLQVNAESRIALPYKTGIVLFLDGGEIGQQYNDLTLSDMKFTVGIGLRYDTVVGPLRLDYGYKLNREPELPDPTGFVFIEDRYEIHFTLGHAF